MVSHTRLSGTSVGVGVGVFVDVGVGVIVGVLGEVGVDVIVGVPVGVGLEVMVGVHVGAKVGAAVGVKDGLQAESKELINRLITSKLIFLISVPPPSKRPTAGAEPPGSAGYRTSAPVIASGSGKAPRLFLCLETQTRQERGWAPSGASVVRYVEVVVGC
jgi:hypothetical protein